MPSLEPHLFPGNFRPREHQRVSLGISLAYRIGNVVSSAVSQNISRGGMGVRSANPLGVGTLLKVRFRVPTSSRDVEVDARVAWSDRASGMGFEFLEVSGADQASIGEFVDAHFFLNRKA